MPPSDIKLPDVRYLRSAARCMRLVRRTVQRVIVANMAAATVAQCLAAVPADRCAAVSAVRKTINENLPDG